MNTWFKGARIFILVYTLTLTLFALFSGAEVYNTGLIGLIYNAPNALPWFLLLAASLASFKYPKPAGLSILILRICSIVFFHFYRLSNLAGLLIIPLPLIISGFLIYSKAPSPSTMEL